MEQILIIQDVEQLVSLKGRIIVVETSRVNDITTIAKAAQKNNYLFCIKLHINQEITSIPFVQEWRKIPLVFYPSGLGEVRDLIRLLPILKKLNITFFLDCRKSKHYEDVQTLSSLGIRSGIIIDKTADWEKLTDLMYFALCGKIPHARIEPFQYLYDIYDRNTFMNYGAVFFEDPMVFRYFTTRDTKGAQGAPRKSWNDFFYETRSCASCAGWRICLGKYAGLEDKTGCKDFTVKLLNLIEGLK